MSNSLIEPYNLSSWAKAKGFTHCFIYSGPSMIPTFHNGDFLYVRSNHNDLQKGDVIIYSAPNIANGYIVHRIISTSNQGFLTHGDHNRLIDEPPITPQKIVGRVEFVENSHGFQSVLNGIWGFWVARIVQWIYPLDDMIRKTFWMPYQIIRKSGIVRHLWKPNILKLHLKNGDGFRLKYIYGHRTVAIWDPVIRQFDVRKPFNLIIHSPLCGTEIHAPDK